MTTFRDKLSDEDRAIYDDMMAKKAENREHNAKAMDDAGVPQAARRGFNRATSNNAYRIKSVMEHTTERKGASSSWGLTVEIYAESSLTYGYIVGPRGASKKVW